MNHVSKEILEPKTRSNSDVREKLLLAVHHLCGTQPYDLRCRAAALAGDVDPERLPCDLLLAAKVIVSACIDSDDDSDYIN
jgi:hypothetical protein